MTKAAKLRSVLADVQPGFASGLDVANGTLQVRMNNVSLDGNLSFGKSRRVPFEGRNAERYLLKPGDVLFNATNSPELVGKSAFFSGYPEPVTFSNHFFRLRPSMGQLDGRYLARWLTHQQTLGLFQAACKQWVNQASIARDRLLEMTIPLPPLAEQKRIAEVLDKADALRAKRRQAIAKLDTLLQSVFLEMFGDPRSPRYQVRQLAECADVASGVTKGRRFNGRPTINVRYIRVANVQDGHLLLDEIKTVEALPRDLEELRLQYGDVLLTEGGDFDKLGRGAMWRDEVPDCIHQNHIFRVRPDRLQLIPEYFEEFLQTQWARAYFLRCAKKTTNLASMNMTQLRALPVMLPPVHLQKHFAKVWAGVQASSKKFERSLDLQERMFSSLQHSAFSGDLGGSRVIWASGGHEQQLQHHPPLAPTR